MHRYRLVKEEEKEIEFLGETVTELELMDMRAIVAKDLTEEQIEDFRKLLKDLGNQTFLIVLPEDTDISTARLERIESEDVVKFPIPYVWSPDQSLAAQKNGAYWERNMLALMLAGTINSYFHSQGWDENYCGWYRHQGDGFDDWSRVISLNGGEITFHVPDDFDLGDLPQIEPNWDGHTTEEKWRRMMKYCGVQIIQSAEE